MKNYQSNNYIAGKWEPKGTGEFQVILDKYQGTEIGKIPQASEEQMEAAIVAANEAFEITKINGLNLEFKVVCSKGTYIRSLANDFGKALNSGAHLSVLRRTKIGDFDVKNALSIEDFIKNLPKKD